MIMAVYQEILRREITMNKRFIIIILAIVVFVVSTTCLISFSENDLTKETAKELLMNAISIRRRLLL